MTLDATLINQIDTRIQGGNGQSDSAAGEPGLAAPAAPDIVSGDSFFDPSALLDLIPTVTGGFGGLGGFGPVGSGPTPTTIDGTIEYFAGGNGGPGGIGGVGGAANFDFANDTIGSSASPYGGTVLFTAKAVGGGGGSGEGGGYGGYAGTDAIASNGYVYEGSAGGSGGNGGAGGAGGTATAEIDALSADLLQDSVFTLEATGGYAADFGEFGSGLPGVGGPGGTGGNGASAGAGGNGAFGGNGGAANAILTASTVTESGTITLELTATGGTGGNGGIGASSATSDDGFTYWPAGDITHPPYTETITNGPPGNGGEGGANGLAIAAFTANSLTAGTAVLTVTAFGGNPGAGGAGGTNTAVPSGQRTDAAGDVINTFTNTPGRSGTGGATVEGQVTLVDNTISVLHELQLALNVEAGTSSAATPLVLDGAAGGNLTFTGNSLIGGAVAELDVHAAGTGDTIDTLHGSISIAGSPANSLSGFSVFDLGSDDTFIAASGTVVTGAGQTVIVAPDADTIVLTPGHAAIDLDGATAANTVLQFQGYGGALDNLTQLDADMGSSSDRTTVNVPGDGVVELPLGWAPGTADVQFAAACYAAGTRILLTRGEVPVETLRAGDRVATHTGTSAPVVWTGRRRVACARQPRPGDVWPVRVAAHAFGPGRPHRALWLSPDHAVYIGGALIPIRLLLNDVTIARMPVDAVTYWHLELPRHGVILAEGLPAESYLDTGNRAVFDEETRLEEWLKANREGFDLWNAEIELRGLPLEHFRQF